MLIAILSHFFLSQTSLPFLLKYVLITVGNSKIEYFLKTIFIFIFSFVFKCKHFFENNLFFLYFFYKYRRVQFKVCRLCHYYNLCDFKFQCDSRVAKVTFIIPCRIIKNVVNHELYFSSRQFDKCTSIDY